MSFSPPVNVTLGKTPAWTVRAGSRPRQPANPDVTFDLDSHFYMTHPTGKWYFGVAGSIQMHVAGVPILRNFVVFSWGGAKARALIGNSGQIKVLETDESALHRKIKEKEGRGYHLSLGAWPKVDELALAGEVIRHFIDTVPEPAKTEAKPKQTRIRKTDYQARIAKAMQLTDVPALLKARDGIRNDIASEQKRLDLGRSHLALLESVIVDRLNT